MVQKAFSRKRRKLVRGDRDPDYVRWQRLARQRLGPDARLQVSQRLLHRHDDGVGRLLELDLPALSLEVPVLFEQLPGQAGQRHDRHERDGQKMVRI